ncbi:hypothetical protein [Marinoscillum sp.]|uniref:hypothetical protein n=1 Tax=Marinoscillum sp. TaxID=2024838 RepID=UPI003BADA875
MDTKFEKLCSWADFFGWVPNVEGRVFFSQTRPNDYGYIDNLVANFVDYQDDHLSTRYLMATTRANLQDTLRRSEEYSQFCGDYRFIFTGKVNDPALMETFGKQASWSDNDKKYDLIGQLVVIHNEHNYLPDLEVRLMQHLALLEAHNQEHLRRIRQAIHYDSLAAGVKAQKLIHEEVENYLNALVSSDQTTIEAEIRKAKSLPEQEPVFYRIYQCDVYIDRSGFLFMKDRTPQHFRHDIVGNGDSDYLKKTFNPRFFKIALSFIKQIFHENKNHPRKHDSLMGISILKGQDPEELLLHQINYLKKDVNQIRHRSSYAIDDLIGYLTFGKSFILTWRRFGMNKRLVNEQMLMLDHTIDSLQSKLFKNRSRINAFLDKFSLPSFLILLIPALILTSNLFGQVYKEEEKSIDLILVWVTITFTLVTLIYMGNMTMRHGNVLKWIRKSKNYPLRLLQRIETKICRSRSFGQVKIRYGSYEIENLPEVKRRIANQRIVLHRWRLKLNTLTSKIILKYILGLLFLASLIFAIVVLVTSVLYQKTGG